MQRFHHLFHGRRGFALIEALIALALIGLGLLAVTKLQTWTLTGAGETKSRTEAVHLSQRKLDELRNQLQTGDFTALASGSQTGITGTHATYAMNWTVSTPTSPPDIRMIQLATTWTDARGISQRLDLNTLVAWDDPGLQSRPFIDTSQSIISPTGEARRGTQTLDPTLGSPNWNRTRTYTDPNTKTTYLMDSSGKVLLYLLPKNNQPQSFTTITGRVYFDPNPARALPASNYVRVRLSSEGECVFDNTTANLETATDSGGVEYSYFVYTCYVGPGWYGNVRVEVSEAAYQGNASAPTLCVGDPGFNNGVAYGSLQTSAHTAESAQRTYRGFRSVLNTMLPTGMQGGSRYGLSYASGSSTPTLLTGPFNGWPVPSGFPTFYSGITSGSATDYFNHDFMVAGLSNTNSCYDKMKGGLFSRNAGHFVCIRPDATPEADQCPDQWPGYQIGTGGSVNYTLDVDVAGSGTVSSQPNGVDCGTVCEASFASGTQVTLTAIPGSGATFAGWSGACTNTSGTCTVTMNGGQLVTATFTGGGGGYTVTVAKVGNGTVVSSPGGIGCGGVCAYLFSAGTTVTLTATAGSGSTFVGWQGACSGTSTTCTLANLAANQEATAVFSAPTCNGSISGSRIDNGGEVSAALPAGTSTCTGDRTTKNYSCTITAPDATNIVLTETGTLPNGDPYSANLSVPWTCSATNVQNANFVKR